MHRLTITLSDEKHRALKEAAVRQGKSIRQIIEESLEIAGIKTRERAKSLVSKARERSQMREDEALKLAVEETKQERKK